MKVIINEQHSLLPEQEEILNSRFGAWEFLRVPANGWTLAEMKTIAKALEGEDVVFCSPVPVLLGLVSKEVGFMGACSRVEDGFSGVVPRGFIFHNDHREKKELPSGKVLMLVAKEGWQLVEL